MCFVDQMNIHREERVCFALRISFSGSLQYNGNNYGSRLRHRETITQKHYYVCSTNYQQMNVRRKFLNYLIYSISISSDEDEVNGQFENTIFVE